MSPSPLLGMFTVRVGHRKVDLEIGGEAVVSHSVALIHCALSKGSPPLQ